MNPPDLYFFGWSHAETVAWHALEWRPLIIDRGTIYGAIAAVSPFILIVP